VDKPSRVHLRLLALVLPLTAVLYIGAEALDPKGTDQVISTMAAAQFLVTSFNSASSHAFTYLYFLTEYTVPAAVMGFALWRSRTVPRWLAALLTAGLEIAEAQSAKGPVVIWFMLPFAVATVLLAARIWRAAAPAHELRQPIEPGNSPVQLGRAA
jgi:hypothetical protein